MAYKQYKGKYVYVIVHYKKDFPMYIGITNNFVRRSGEHRRASYGTKFADSIPKHLRKARYRMMVYDFSAYEEITDKDLRILESYITCNFASELSTPVKLSKEKQERLEVLLDLVGDIKPKVYEVIKQEKLREAGKLKEVSYF